MPSLIAALSRLNSLQPVTNLPLNVYPLFYATFSLLIIFRLLLCYLMVRFAVVVLILHEKVLVCAVSGEQDGSRAEARQGAAEAVEASKGTLRPPGISVKSIKFSLALSNVDFVLVGLGKD